MFEFLNKVLGRAVPIEVVGYEPPEITFHSKKPIDIGLTDVHANIAGVKIKARIQVVESGVDSSKAYWIEPKEAVPYLEEIFTPSEKRRDARYPRRLRVRSPQLPGFQGNSLDISNEGMRLESEGAIEPGRTVYVQFELDDARETLVSLEAVVRWAGPSLREGWTVAGLEYQNLKTKVPESYGRYKDFLANLGDNSGPF